MKGAYKKEKEKLVRKADELDKKAKYQHLNQHEIHLKQSIKIGWPNSLERKKLNGFKELKLGICCRVIVTRNTFSWWQMARDEKLGFLGLNKKRV